MENRNKMVDDYISKSADFAKPVLIHLRKLIHATCPKVEETIKWGFPNFIYHGLLCNMASFKSHCAFGFWKATLMKDAEALKQNNRNGMGHAGKIRSLGDLPPDKIINIWIKEAMKLNEDGIKLPKTKNTHKPEIILPDCLKKELLKYKKANNTFINFSPSHKREYIEWINEAKTEETKKKRVLTTIEWLIEGKRRNWKYERK